MIEPTDPSQESSHGENHPWDGLHSRFGVTRVTSVSEIRAEPELLKRYAREIKATRSACFLFTVNVPHVSTGSGLDSPPGFLDQFVPLSEEKGFGGTYLDASGSSLALDEPLT
jgi:hypothetical protein